MTLGITSHAVERRVILRCANCKTLELAASLTDAGFEAWSPVEVEKKLVKDPRKLIADKVVETRIPLTPSFVFANADRMDDLLALSHSPTLNYRIWDSELRRMVTKGHPHFRLFRHLGEIAVIAAVHLEPLRNIERRRKPRGAVKPIAVGTLVRLTEGGFAGMTGMVDSVRGKRAIVSFSQYPFPVEFPTWLLREELDRSAAVNVNTRPSERAAHAA
jgi:transcription antitermination factor NusG